MAELTTYQSELHVGTKAETQVINDQLEAGKLYQLTNRHLNSTIAMQEGICPLVKSLTQTPMLF